MFEFSYGSTRWVFCIGDLAFKIARPMIIPRLRSKKRLDLERLIQILRSAIVDGIVANLEERRFYKANPDKKVAPTLFSLLGVVNICRRGTIIKEEDLQKCPFRESSYFHKDLKKVEHFGWIDGEIYLLDYGFRPIN
jgi:hypothetical protein